MVVVIDHPGDRRRYEEGTQRTEDDTEDDGESKAPHTGTSEEEDDQHHQQGTRTGIDGTGKGDIE